MSFCRWYQKQLENVTEYEQEQCEKNGQDCMTCPDLLIKENVMEYRTEVSKMEDKE